MVYGQNLRRQVKEVTNVKKVKDVTAPSLKEKQAFAFYPDSNLLNLLNFLNIRNLRPFFYPSTIDH